MHLGFGLVLTRVNAAGASLSAARAPDGSVVVSTVSAAPTVVRNPDGTVTVTAVH